MEEDTKDICRVCHAEGSEAKPLFYPCLCAGSIKYVHEDCLLQWIDHTKRESCELCNHPYAITSLFAPDVPNRLPVKEALKKVFNNVKKIVRLILRILLLGVMPWLVVTPILVCRTRRMLFAEPGSNSAYLDLVSLDNLTADLFRGLFQIICSTVVVSSACGIIEQIDSNVPVWLRNAPMRIPRAVNFAPVLANDGANVGPVLANGAANVGPVLANDAANVAPGLANGAAEVNNVLRAHRNLENRRTASEIIAELRANFDNQQAVNIAIANANAQDDNGPLNRGYRFGRAAWGSTSVVTVALFVIINTFVVFVFEYCPYRLGFFALYFTNFERVDSFQQLEHVFTLLCGYCLFGFLFYLLYLRSSPQNFPRAVWGYFFLIVKVGILAIVEFGIFPALCGWWLNICSLPLFNSTIKDLETSFTGSPLLQIVFFWIYGVVYLFIFHWFEQILRHVLRPGALWFLRNWRGPDYNPIHEMINYPLYIHVHRLLLAIIMFGTLILLGFWLPSNLVKCYWLDFLPYKFTSKENSTLLEALSLEVLLKNIWLSAALHDVFGLCTKIFWLTRKWCFTMAQLLNIHSFLLGEICHQDLINNPDLKEQLAELFPEVNFGFPEEDIQDVTNESAGSQVISETSATELIQEDPKVVTIRAQIRWRQMRVQLLSINMAFARLRLNEPFRAQPYLKTRHLYVKVSILLVSACISLTLLGIFVVTAPVAVGRLVLKYLLQSVDDPIHDLTAFILGTFVIRCIMNMFTFIDARTSIRRENGRSILKNWAVPVAKAIIAAPFIIGIIPYLIGLLYKMFMNIQIQSTRSPIYVPEVIWLIGMWMARAVYEIGLLFPQHNWLRRALDRIHTYGLRQINLTFIMRALVVPSVVRLCLALAVPYVIGNSIVPLLIPDVNTRNLTYPVLAACIILRKIAPTLHRVSTKLFARVMDNRQRIGRRLVNYERPAATT